MREEDYGEIKYFAFQANAYITILCPTVERREIRRLSGYFSKVSINGLVIIK